MALPAKFGGLGIQNLVETYDNDYSNSIKITKDLTNLIYLQEQSSSKQDKDNISKCKESLRNDKVTRFREELDPILETFDPLTVRYINTAKEKSASACLTADGLHPQ